MFAFLSRHRPSSILYAFVLTMSVAKIAKALPVAVLAAVHRENQRKLADAVMAVKIARVVF